MTCHSEAPSYPVRGEDNEMETWGAGVIFQSTPCPALLNYTCSSSCPGVRSCSVGSRAEPVTGESVGDVWRVAGRQWRPPGGSDCWVSRVSRSTLCLFPPCISQGLNSSLEGTADLSVEKGAPLGRWWSAIEVSKGKDRGMCWAPESNAVRGTIALAPEIIALYTIVYLVNRRAPS